jgi:hypothetical protein
VEAFARSLLGAGGITVSHAAAVADWGTARYSGIEIFRYVTEGSFDAETQFPPTEVCAQTHINYARSHSP